MWSHRLCLIFKKRTSLEYWLHKHVNQHYLDVKPSGEMTITLKKHETIKDFQWGEEVGGTLRASCWDTTALQMIINTTRSVSPDKVDLFFCNESTEVALWKHFGKYPPILSSNRPPCHHQWTHQCIITSLRQHQGDKWTAIFPPRNTLHPCWWLCMIQITVPGGGWGGGGEPSQCPWGWWLWMKTLAAITQPLIPDVTWMCVFPQCGADPPPTPPPHRPPPTHPDFLRHCNQSPSLWSVMRWCVCTGPLAMAVGMLDVHSEIVSYIWTEGESPVNTLIVTSLCSMS